MIFLGYNNTYINFHFREGPDTISLEECALIVWPSGLGVDRSIYENRTVFEFVNAVDESHLVGVKRYL